MAQSDPFIPDRVLFVIQYTHTLMIARFFGIYGHDNTHENSILRQFLASKWKSAASWHLQPQNHGGMAQSDPFIPDRVMLFSLVFEISQGS